MKLYMVMIMILVSFMAYGISHPAEDIAPGTFGANTDTYTFAGDIIISGTCTGCTSSGATQWQDDGSGIFYNSGNVGIGAASESTENLHVESGAGTDSAIKIVDTEGKLALSVVGLTMTNGAVGINSDPTAIPHSKALGVSGGIATEEVYLGDAVISGTTHTQPMMSLDAPGGISLNIDSGKDVVVDNGNLRIIDGKIFLEQGGSVYRVEHNNADGWFFSGSQGGGFNGPLVSSVEGNSNELMVSADSGTITLNLASGSNSWKVSNSGSFTINGGGSDRFLIESGGDVGIGVSNPSHKLEVGGTGSFSDSLSSASLSTGAIFGHDLDVNDDASIGGDLSVAGTITAATVTAITCCSSDIRQKTQVRPIDDALNKLMALRGVNFYWKVPGDFGVLGYRQQTGFIAQELEQVFPDFVFTSDDGYKKIITAGFPAVLVEAVKEQQAIINDMQSEIDLMKSEICAMNPESKVCD